MKKNLKKVISAVIAFALSASAFASVSFAKSFTDVASTASYAEAVDVLSALGIINGYEDGTFGPDKTIKRSEAAKIIVAMVNKIATAEGRMGATQFDDVAADHWAAGFINVGVSDGFINGKSATRFDPDGEVKYNEIVKMIVSCLGYEEYAQFYGGYPTGYVSIADSEGITKGCSMDGNAAATRAVVAQLVYNALKTPIIQSKGMQYSAAQGGFVPNIEKQDGEESKYFKSLLTEKFDAYLVEGTVTETKKTNEALDADEVTFRVDKSETYDNDDIIEVNENYTEIVFSDAVKVGETAAADYINTYANAIMQLNDDEEYVMLSFVPSGKNKVATLDLALIDEDEHDSTNISTTILASSNPYIKIFASEDASKSTKYKLQSGFKLYVNGVAIDNYDATDIETYIINNMVGKIELTDTYKSDDGYDIVSVEYFGTAKVGSVTAKKIYLTGKMDKFSGGTITLDTEENEDLVYHIYYNDEEVAVTDIQKDDILSIAYDVKKGIDSNFFEIYVSRDTVEGKFSGLDTEDDIATIAGEKYTFVNYSQLEDTFKSDNMGNEYKVFLDKFGRIFASESIASSVKYAIADKVATSSNWDNKGLRLYFTDGTYKNYEVDYSRTGLSDEDLDDIILDNTGSKKDVQDRVVKYKISTTTTKITELEVIGPKAGNGSAAEYAERTYSLGAIRMNEATNIIDASEYVETNQIADLVKSSLTALTDGVEYIAYAYGDKSNNAYPFVLIVEGASQYTEDTAIAVVTKELSTKSKDDGTEGYELAALYEGSLQTLFVTDDATLSVATGIEDDPETDKDEAYDVSSVDVDSLMIGDVVVFQVNATGDIDELDLVFRMKATNEEEKPVYLHDTNSYGYVMEAGLAANVGDYIMIPDGAKKVWTTSWETDNDQTTAAVFGVITDNQDGYFELGQVKDGQTQIDLAIDGANLTGGTMDIDVNTATNVYVYNYANTRSNRFSVGTTADIQATYIPSASLDESGAYDVITWNNEAKDRNAINFAFAKVVDGMATDVFVILGDSSYIVK